MPRILVLGGGVCGLSAAMMLARDGHDVVVLERDAEPVPDSVDEAWERWTRGGVSQFRLAHYLQPLARHVLDTELPDVRDALEAAGGLWFDPLTMMPPSITDRSPRPGDERFRTITARRSTFEQVVGRAAENERGVDIRRGVAIDSLVTRDLAGALHVTGVRTASGEELPADLVVDAMGRRSPLPSWLRRDGADPIEEDAEDSGFIYYSRFYRAGTAGTPAIRAGLSMPIGSFSILTLPGDNDTWSVTLYTSTGDRPLKRLRDPDRFTAVLRSCPLHAHWLDGEPDSGVIAMGGILDRHRRLRMNGRAPVTGVAMLGDAWACTNPSLGRGISFGLTHAALLRGVVRDHLEDPQTFAATWDSVSDAELMPWYRDTIALDRAHLAGIDAARTGAEPIRPTATSDVVHTKLPLAMRYDADLFRGFLDIRSCLATAEEVFARPGFAERVFEIADELEPSRMPGPTREQLLELLA
jgi:2-polyprenyl-6-methoxyphenol hydroxylase-like FAD-dependent oxidoreductase